ncbi:MAG: hypothetical protein JWN21_1341 [Sphingomonas bacterium]|uniref:copper chaperone PCu(A)C n=1 Tax=Sphingomonas bacterium TaxID=1895847 RepID=UPI002629AACD|nr:copper chaperone PCu(A)C [Sphingomonas bacterium]MDB5695798.1 hypothetical protein [Sphingomonas bacterium]
MRWIATVLAVALLTGCQGREPQVTNAWVRLPAVPGRPAAAYFTIKAGDVGRTLLGVGGTAFKRAELHESMAKGMRALPTVTIAAGEEVAFAPAGRHVMLYDVDPAVTPGATVPLQLTFGDEKSVTIEARVVGAADPAPE